MFDNKFDNTYKKCLKENILTNFASGFQKGLEKSEKGRLPWQEMGSDKKEETQKQNLKPIGFENKPKINETILFPLKNNTFIKGKVLTNINQKGQWEIELSNDKNSADPLYYYISDLYPNGVITTPNYMKSTHKTSEQINSVEGPYVDCIVGFNTVYSKWFKEEDMKKNY